MAMRLSGLMSGMDTESIVQQLVEARRGKVTNATNAQTKLGWKQDAWKDLNKKLKNLQSKFLSNMRFTSGYTQKTTKVSNSSAVSVITGENAVNGVQRLEVGQLAKTAYLTGGKVEKRKEVLPDTDNIKMGDLLTFEDDGAGNEVAKSLKVSINGGEQVEISFGSETTVSEVIEQMEEAGLKVDYDEANGKFLYSSEAGAAVSLSADADVRQLLTPGVRKPTVSKDELSALSKLSDLMVFEKDGDGKEIAKNLKLTAGGKDVDIELTSSTTISDVLTKLKESGLNANFDANQNRFYISARESGADGDFSITGDEDALNALGLGISKEFMEDGSVVENGTGGATFIHGQNAKITLNGAEYENNTNTFEINGLTITAMQETDEPVTITTQQDTDGIYDMIKNFLKEYNSIINEMDKLYNADSAKDYEPLSDEEKKNMSESEIEKYEGKIKDSLLRRDSNLSKISTAMKQIMMSGFEVDGEEMHLFDFGIETLSYFSAPDNERNAYHIAGDPDDADSSGKDDKLKGLIASDPDKVISFFTQLSQSLYTEMNEQSKSVEGYRSFGSFYDDKKMKSDYDDYKTKIKDLEKKLSDYEDKWYAKFAAMETAMAKMQRNASAVTGLLGGGMQ